MNRVSKKHRSMWDKCRNEVIEIGAVKLENDVIIDTYRQYVKPEYNSSITEKVKELTHITMDMVIDKPVLEKVMDEFVEWCGKDCEVYAWSDTDLKQIRSECAAKEINVSEQLDYLMNHWIDYQKVFGKMCHIDRLLSLDIAVKIAGLDFSGRAHDALTDAMNTAQIYIRSKTTDFDNVQGIIDDVFSEHKFSMGDIFNFDMIKLAS